MLTETAPIVTGGDAAPTRRTTLVLTRLVVAAPLALAVAVGFHPNDTSDAADSLARIADADRLRWVVAHIVEPLAWLGLGYVLLMASRVRTAAWPRAVRIGGVLGAVGSAATALIVYSHGEAMYFMTEDAMDPAAMEALYTHYQETMPLVGPLGILFRLGLILLGAGLYRSRTVPRWAAAALMLAPVAMMPVANVPPAVGALVVGLPLVAGFAGSARAIASANARQA